MTLCNGFPAVSGAATQFDIRRDLAGLFECSAPGTVIPGLLPSAPATIITGRNDMKLDVAAFPALLERRGAVLVYNDGVVQTPALAAAPAANSRIDLIYVKQQEKASPISDAADGPVIGVATGTASAVPPTPVTPDGAIALGTVTVPAGASTTLSPGVVIRQGTQRAYLAATKPFRTGQATIYPGWSGYCRWQQTGRMVNVEFGVSRTDGTFTRSAWDGASCADGLPKARDIQAPGQSSYCSNFAVSNASSNPGAYAIRVSNSGILWLDAWWSERLYLQGCWWAGRFTYETTDV